MEETAQKQLLWFVEKPQKHPQTTGPRTAPTISVSTMSHTMFVRGLQHGEI